MGVPLGCTPRLGARALALVLALMLVLALPACGRERWIPPPELGADLRFLLAVGAGTVRRIERWEGGPLRWDLAEGDRLLAVGLDTEAIARAEPLFDLARLDDVALELQEQDCPRGRVVDAERRSLRLQGLESVTRAWQDERWAAIEVASIPELAHVAVALPVDLRCGLRDRRARVSRFADLRDVGLRAATYVDAARVLAFPRLVDHAYLLTPDRPPLDFPPPPLFVGRLGAPVLGVALDRAQSPNVAIVAGTEGILRLSVDGERVRFLDFYGEPNRHVSEVALDAGGRAIAVGDDGFVATASSSRGAWVRRDLPIAASIGQLALTGVERTPHAIAYGSGTLWLGDLTQGAAGVTTEVATLATNSLLAHRGPNGLELISLDSRGNAHLWRPSSGTNTSLDLPLPPGTLCAPADACGWPTNRGSPREATDLTGATEAYADRRLLLVHQSCNTLVVNRLEDGCSTVLELPSELEGLSVRPAARIGGKLLFIVDDGLLVEVEPLADEP
ncbi:MAG: hypothetical protein IT384_11280 [Deltaproteobacteria bacterium]|nr:hypothetical protein [Deltaproteobacteria bacterium]